MKSFTYSGSPAHIVFGNGASSDVATWVEKLGCERALVLSTQHQAADGEALAKRLGALAVGVFPGAAMHTPVEVTEAALAKAKELGADCVVALGGGSTTGLGKAIAYRTDLPQIVIPTTYAGSEVTPILGQTENGAKTTVRDASILPEVVIYDPELTLGLPMAMSVTSGLNAMAHAAEALYAQDRNPVSTLMATEGLRALLDALPILVKEPRHLEARGDALYGAWLCGTVLGTVGMALHHKICHTLGGSFDMPHAETHAVMLPHTIGFNAGAVPDLLEPVARLFGGSPGGGLHDFARSVGAPLTLSELGLKQVDLDRAAEIATQNPYWNPRPFDRAAIRALLQDAWEGRRPQN
ncbi:maleylacetate reductase [Mesorhizobium sp. INR15]|uniref:maleylacetate reductase n=1 Tax=Mesorhizobium sp. INR15 TaxID=2654248 RepID=UPI00189676CD|nr:maleylacetate reductase [Mesorhizobium sp. INR15]QPC90188.1 iron-containing alcohol dehydrogenase [Mesorhizobium sp. INR15]